MKTRNAWLAVLCLALAAVPAWAQSWSYDNGPINGTTDAWTINFGYVVSDTFVAGGASVNGFSFGKETIFSNDILLSVDWSITSGENSGTTFGSGTASGANLTDKPVSTNQFGFIIDEVTVTGLNVPTTSGTTYWLNLQNATVADGDPVYWDENSGKGCGGNGCPSRASESSVGTIPSESFTISGGSSGTTPEPSSFMLLASGVLGLTGVLRRRL
jgi:PEP-CTERM motif